jgi:hypothetical protein
MMAAMSKSEMRRRYPKVHDKKSEWLGLNEHQ